MSAEVEIVGINSSHRYNPVSDQALNHLAELLKALPGSPIVKVNAYGEAYGPSSTQLWSPKTVAGFVLSGPEHVWIDWCGWPGYYQVSSAAQVSVPAAAGWAALATALGYRWLTQADFAVPFGQKAVSLGGGRIGGFPLSRGWDLGPSQNGVLYSGSGQVTLAGVRNLEGFFGTILGNLSAPASADGYAMLADVHHGSMGHYMYAAADPSIITYPQYWVDAQSVAAFVARALAAARGTSGTETQTNQQSGVASGGKYNVHAPSPTQASGPTTPILSGGGGSGTTPKVKPPPIDWRTVGLVAGGAAAAGGLAFALANMLREGS